MLDDNRAVLVPTEWDAWWQMHCNLKLERPPAFDLGLAGRDRFYRFLEATWMAQQLPVAALLFMAGGWGWVVWGVCVRVTVSVTGHWFVGHLAHRTGPQSWLVNDAGVQAHDVPWAAIPTMGEAWHNNHHAFPGSARIGLYPGQNDWGYAFLLLLERVGLAWNIALPEHLAREGALTRVAPEHLHEAPPAAATAGRGSQESPRRPVSFMSSRTKQVARPWSAASTSTTCVAHS